MMKLFSTSRWAERAGHPNRAIMLVTFGILALELALIRWTSSQVRIFAYFNNIVLICAFLGMGLGVALGRKRPGLVHFALPVLLLLAIPLGFADALHFVDMPFPDQTISLWGGTAVPANLGMFARNMGIFLGLLGLVIATFVCCGAPLGYLFGRVGTLRAYHADLLGSLLGVLVFTGCAWLNAGPAVWLALGCLPFVWLSRHWISVAAAAGVIWLGFYSVQGAIYSPYNRIDLVPSDQGLVLKVNRDFHQYMLNLSDAAISDPHVSAVERGIRHAVRQLYDLPFQINRKHDTALIVGAGTGNDVQAALRHGYRHVVSVDIDGRIIDLGRKLHPEAPYKNPAVEPVVDDARAYFEKDTDRKFDVVCFGLLDSHAMSSAMSTLRLDNYVYTEQGIRAAWNRVGPGGHLSLAISCLAGRWFYERLHWTITKATGREPIDYFSPLHGGTFTFIVPRADAVLDPAAEHLEPILHPLATERQTFTTSDDWPFLYIRPGAIPWGYGVVLATLLLVAGVSVRMVFGLGRGGAGCRRFHWPLFLMGAAFLLIETRGVTSLSLLFGSTWVVNSAVFAGVLVMVLVGNAAVRRWKWDNATPWFVLLFTLVAGLYVFPVEWLVTLPLPVRGLLGGLATGAPVGVAGVIVPMLLRRAADPAAALGANLLGAVLGGCLEYASMYAGLSAMMLVALALYLAAYLLVRRTEQQRSAAGVAEPALAGAAAE